MSNQSRSMYGDHSVTLNADQMKQIKALADHLRGVWCNHGKRIMVPADDTPHSSFVFAEPWPCDICTISEIERLMEQDEAEYWNSLYADYQADIAAGLSQPAYYDDDRLSSSRVPLFEPTEEDY